MLCCIVCFMQTDKPTLQIACAEELLLALLLVLFHTFNLQTV